MKFGCPQRTHCSAAVKLVRLGSRCPKPGCLRAFATWDACVAHLCETGHANPDTEGLREQCAIRARPCPSKTV
jgi:hypothetical protein